MRRLPGVEVVHPVLVVGDTEEEGVHDLTEGGEVIVCWLPFDGGACGHCRGEDRRDLLGRHDAAELDW